MDGAAVRERHRHSLGHPLAADVQQGGFDGHGVVVRVDGLHQREAVAGQRDAHGVQDRSEARVAVAEMGVDAVQFGVGDVGVRSCQSLGKLPD